METGYGHGSATGLTVTASIESSRPSAASAPSHVMSLRPGHIPEREIRMKMGALLIPIAEGSPRLVIKGAYSSVVATRQTD